MPQNYGVTWPWPRNFGALNANISKTAEGTNFKFGRRVPMDSPDMTPDKCFQKVGGFFRFRFRMAVPNFIEIGSKLWPWEHGQTDRQTDTQRSHGWSYNLAAINGTDNYNHTEINSGSKLTACVWIFVPTIPTAAIIYLPVSVTKTTFIDAQLTRSFPSAIYHTTRACESS